MSIWTQVARQLTPMALASLHESTAIQQSARVRTPGGFITKTWNTIASNVPCRVVPASVPQGEVLTADQLRAWNHWQVYLPAETVVTEGMRLAVAGTYMDGNAWSRIFEVLATDGPKSFEVLRMATCADILTVTGS